MANSTKLQWPAGVIDFSSGCVIMGILNVTDDSFSDGGKFIDIDVAIAHALEMARAGAAIIDIGPESTRPGSDPVSTNRQIERAIPIIEKLSQKTNAVISIDTADQDVAEAALKAGAGMLNDVTAMSDDRMAKLAADKNVPIVLMHMQGSPKTMQLEPKYDDVVSEVKDYLLKRAAVAIDMGVSKEMIFIDPGIGFGKTTEHNLELLRNIDEFAATGFKVLVGSSRKRFIGQLTGKQIPAERLMGTAATVALCAAMGVSVVRVHDVGSMVDVVNVANALRS
ncbi:MAG: dihydropteroate synthase [Sedimentisphaerales bacterium]|nr:dihydropteroate synthase [Sedimentisphaerales bacterium]